MEIIRSADAGTLTVSGVDRISMESRLNSWQEEVNDNLDRMGAFEVF